MAVVALFRDVFINKQEIVLWKFENGEADATNQFQKGARFITRKVFSNKLNIEYLNETIVKMAIFFSLTGTPAGTWMKLELRRT